MGTDSKPLEVVIYTPQELNHSSYVRTGLFELEKRGYLKCRVSFDAKCRRGRISTHSFKIEKSGHSQPKTSFYKIQDRKKKREILFAVDAYDIPYYFSESALNDCDFIFKRNYEERFVTPLNSKYGKKIYPLGLTFRVRSQYEHGKPLFFLSLLLINIRLILKRNKNVFKKIISTVKESYQHWIFAHNSRLLESFNNNPVHKKDKQRIIFQTRCFPGLDDPDCQEIHKQRSDLIRILKAKFGDSFMGGIVPDEISRKHFPDCLTNLPTDPQSYLDLVKTASIAVYTRGLAHSPAWKLAEYASQGKCVVSERLTAELPTPLEHEKHLMYFDSEEECVSLCKRLIDDPKQAEILSLNIRAYYERHIDPVQNVQRIINFMLEKNKA